MGIGEPTLCGRRHSSWNAVTGCIQIQYPVYLYTIFVDRCCCCCCCCCCCFLSVRLLLYRNSSFVTVLVKVRQVHAHSSRRQSNSLCLRHVHSGVISIEQGGIHALRLEVGNELFCDGSRGGVFAGEGGSKLCMHRGSGSLEDGSGRKFADYRAVDGAQLRW